jgi:nucleoside 2-deoxyribosyltransferase
MMKKSWNVFIAGELFNAKHLFGNAVLAEIIEELSNKRYQCALPQNIEKRLDTAQMIRDEDINSVLSADIGLFNYDGLELDSGTVVEYLFAKIADIPSVILRTDFRKGGDQGTEPWNLMTSFFPRTEVVILNAMSFYQEEAKTCNDPSDKGCVYERKINAKSYHMMRRIAEEVIAAMDRVVQIKPIMPEEKRETIYEWIATFPGFLEDQRSHFSKLLQQKIEKNLL